MPTVSLIIPIYNAEKYLRRCLNSVCDQTFTDMEVLLVNDGSTDDSLALCREYAQKDSRFRVIDKENTGVSDSRNRAMQAATGTYLQFMDSDDWLTPLATETLVRAAQTGDCDLVIADFYRVTEAHYAEQDHIETNSVLTRNEFALYMMDDPADFYYGVMWNKLYRRSIIVEHGLQCDTEFSWCEDFLFNLHFLRYVQRVRAVQTPIYYYMKRKGSLVFTELSKGGSSVQVKMQLLEEYKAFYKDIGLYEDNVIKVNAFLVQMAKDGHVPWNPIDPRRKKLDEEAFIPEPTVPKKKKLRVVKPDPARQEYAQLQARMVMKGLKKRQMKAWYCPTKEQAAKKLLSLIPKGSTVAWGGSRSVEALNIKDTLRLGDYKLLDTDAAADAAARRSLYQQSLGADVYLMSANAVTEDGILVNMDGRGNRVAALSFGPAQVLLVVGVNKIEPDTQAAVQRVRSRAAVQNALRLHRDTPCTRTGKCADCLSSDCICGQLLITRFSLVSGRIGVILVGEPLGY